MSRSLYIYIYKVCSKVLRLKLDFPNKNRTMNEMLIKKIERRHSISLFHRVIYCTSDMHIALWHVDAL